MAPAPQKKGRPSSYGAEVTEALAPVWEAADRMCGKLLVAVLPELVASLERHGELGLASQVRQVLAMPATNVKFWCFRSFSRISRPDTTEARRLYLPSAAGLAAARPVASSACRPCDRSVARQPSLRCPRRKSSRSLMISPEGGSSDTSPSLIPASMRRSRSDR